MRKQGKKGVVTKPNGLEAVIFVKLRAYSCEKLHILSIMLNQFYKNIVHLIVNLPV